MSWLVSGIFGLKGAVIDSLRPVTQQMWRSLPLVEQRRFPREDVNRTLESSCPKFQHHIDTGQIGPDKQHALCLGQSPFSSFGTPQPISERLYANFFPQLRHTS